MKYHNWQRWAFILGMGGSIQYIILTSIAMLFYKGGTYDDPNNPGYSFFINFFSDLGRTIAHSGEPNTIGWLLFSTTLLIAGMTLIISMAAYFNLFRVNKAAFRLSMSGSFLGMFAGLAFIGIAFTPSDILPEVHLLFVSIGFGLVFPVAILYSIAMWIVDYPRRYTSIFLIFAVIQSLYLLLLFLGHTVEGFGTLLIQATGQKIIVYSMILNNLFQNYGAFQIQKMK